MNRGFPQREGIPVSTVQQPLDTPADRLAAMVGGWDRPAILESGRGFGEAGRWSIYAAVPRLVFEAVGTHWSIDADGKPLESGDGDPLAALDRLVRRFGLARSRPSRSIPMHHPSGGADRLQRLRPAPRLERLPRRLPRDSRWPDIRMALYDTAIVHDVRTGAVDLLAWDLTGEGRGRRRTSLRALATGDR